MPKTIVVRQGDVLLRSVHIPNDAIRQQVTGRRAIMAYGEVTGHAHALEAQDIELYEKDGRTFVRVINAAGVSLTHEEHGSILVPKGDYERVVQREYSPEEIRKVLD